MQSALTAQHKIKNRENLGTSHTSVGRAFRGSAFRLHCLRQRLTPPLQSLVQKIRVSKRCTEFFQNTADFTINHSLLHFQHSKHHLINRFYYSIQFHCLFQDFYPNKHYLNHQCKLVFLWLISFKNARTIGKGFRVFKKLQRKVLGARSVSCETVENMLLLAFSQTAVQEINFSQKIRKSADKSSFVIYNTFGDRQ